MTLPLSPSIGSFRIGKLTYFQRKRFFSTKSVENLLITVWTTLETVTKNGPFH